jgi:DNA polymerase I - 3''-5'' exonuclease and polymerase domains
MIKSPMVDGDPKTAKFLIVAMSPGEEELDQGAPLVGPTGHMLWTWLGKAGVHRPDCLLLNTIGELPEGSSGKTITPEQYDKYWEEFDEVCRSFQGTTAIVLGGDALWRFTGLSGGIESWRGYVVEPTEGSNIERRKRKMAVYKSGPKKGQPKITHEKVPCRAGMDFCPKLKVIIPTLHPSGVMKQGNMPLPAMVADLNRAVRAQANPIEFLRIVKDTPLASWNTGALESQSNVVAFDVEGYDYITDVGLCFEGKAPHSWKWGQDSRATTKRVLEDHTIIKVAHNAPFDLEMLTTEDVEVCEPIADTMLMAAMVEPDMPKGLKYVVPMYMDVKRWDIYQDESVNYYNACDVWHTKNLFWILQNILIERGQWQLFMEVIMPCVPTFMELSRIGLYIDGKRKREWTDKLGKKLLDLDIEWHKLVPNVQWTKLKELKSYLQNELKLEIRYNKYGAQTLDENAIRTHILEYPEHKDKLECLLQLRETQKELSTYANIDVTMDSTIHPSYLPAGKDDDRYDEDGDKAGKGLAGTWRPTSRKPNCQNLTKDARKMYVPRQKGYVFVEMDFNSFEARILGWLSEDKELLKAIDDDLHGVNAKKLNVDRTRAKNGFYGWSYGSGAVTLQRAFRGKGYSVSNAECKALLKGFDKAYPKAAAYRDRLITLGKEAKCITNPFGLKRFFYMRDPGTAPANTMIQSTAAIIMWKILPKLAAEAKRQGGMMVAMVHDSVEFELPEAFDTVPFRQIMEQEFPEIAPGFYCPIDIKYGPSWGEVQLHEAA